MAEVELGAENGFDPDPDHLKGVIKGDSDLNSRFHDIIQVTERDIIRNDLHEMGRVNPTGGFTIFYRYFFSKYVSVRQNIDARSGMMEKHASIFPFQTDSNLPINRVAVSEFFEDDFLSQIRKFVDQHFSDAFDFEHLKDLFLTNIDHFKKKHFQPPPSLRKLTNVIGLGSSWRRETAPEDLSDYFDHFIRLNQAGIEWYRHFQTKFNDICDLYQRERLKLPEKSDSYFKYLPEINCCELLLLLEEEFFRRDRRKYTEIFEKYLFFFGHAIRSADPHPVSFIDETLFRCLLSKRRYQTFRGDILELQWDLWMMTLVHRRKHPLPRDQRRRRIRQRPDADNLREVVKYADQIPNIESATVYYGEPQYRRFKIFLVYDDVAFLMGYSRRSVENGLSLNYGQILKSALMNREIRTLVHYNPCLGLESRVNMPANGTAIREFVRELTELHRPGPLYPERFLVIGLENYFETLPAATRT